MKAKDDKKEIKAYIDMVAKDLVNQLKRRAKELKEEKEKRNDPVQRYMRTARRVNAKTGGLLGNPSRMRNR